MDTIVFDIETKNLITSPGGKLNVDKMEVSMVCAYSYNENKYYSFTEHEMAKAEEFFKRAGLVIGHTIVHFDLPILQKYFSFNTMALRRVDLLEEVELVFGRRIGLDALAKANLGTGKTHTGLEAIKFYREGKIEELRNYCLNDVKLTKELYDLAKKQKFLHIPDRYTEEMHKVEFDWKEIVIPATLF